jgi:type IV pilus assembly protein PilE
MGEKVMQHQFGFTLIELVIVVAIIAILSGIAYPSFISYILRSNRTDAYQALLKCASEQERWFTANNTYLSDAAAQSNGRCGNVSGGVLHSPEGHYQLTITNPGCVSGFSASCFTVSATGIGKQVDDTDCPTLTIDENGLQLPATCWKK